MNQKNKNEIKNNIKYTSAIFFSTETPSIHCCTRLCDAGFEAPGEVGAMGVVTGMYGIHTWPRRVGPVSQTYRMHAWVGCIWIHTLAGTYRIHAWLGCIEFTRMGCMESTVTRTWMYGIRTVSRTCGTRMSGMFRMHVWLWRMGFIRSGMHRIHSDQGPDV